MPCCRLQAMASRQLKDEDERIKSVSLVSSLDCPKDEARTHESSVGSTLHWSKMVKCTPLSASDFATCERMHAEGKTGLSQSKIHLPSPLGFQLSKRRTHHLHDGQLGHRRVRKHADVLCLEVGEAGNRTRAVVHRRR